ncbi:transporter substrate-binding domain-containing protein [Paenibacillus sp. WQ 127069]|jgi:L-cystine transport system substrate-binding protein|uniref:Transporter substrate-binding domain-containing protein n=1 Tax=Paenibacillus baimaensis TaxID=2982185 RepID=A0ABT2UII4_9BACL|nr:transporter substrate-binding domain-containing protein [Paenibacillus sp. WQ 127069]MCU6794438.1 transporter substrate-binding domain-containing protein [Paenibacillus sp. WQ 127069]
MKKTRFHLLFAVVLLTVLAGCGKTAPAADGGSTPASATPAAASTAKAAPKVIKSALNTVPVPLFSFLDEKNQPAGFMIDYLKELEKKLPEYKFEYESVDNEGQLIGTDTGKYAFAANFWFKNPEREKKYLYPQQEFGYSITGLAVKPDRNDIKTLDDLVGKKLVPMTPVSGFRYILKDYNLKHPGKEIKIEDVEKTTPADDLKLVESGKYDAHLLNINHFEDAVKKLNLNLKIGGVISKESVYLLFNKNQTELAQKMDAATVELIKDGTLPKLSEKWFKVDVFKSLEYVQQGYKFRKD